MTTPVFPSIEIGEKSTRTKSDRVKSARFGDGYEETARDGLNSVVEQWNLQFTDYDIADIKTITDFLDARGSVEHFLWTPPDEVTPKKWRQIGDYKVSFNGPLTRSLTVEIQRVYTL